jgi:outer membrane immunogenic protein
MRKTIGSTAVAAVLMLSGGAQAADMRPAPPVPYVAPVFNWTGFYLGGNIGGAWGRRDVEDTRFGLDFGRSSDGVFIFGGQVGYNYQMGRFVLGVEADISSLSGGDRRGNGVIVPGIVGPIAVTAEDSWVSTVAARFGYTNGNWLLYGKAGGGWLNAKDITVTNLSTGASITGGGDRSRSGGLFGVGIEYAFGNNWTMKFEYDHLSLGSRSFVVPAGSPFPALVGDTFTIDRSVDMFKFGVNYLFSSGGYGGGF